MIHTAKTVGTLQAVAMTVAVALFLWSTGLPTLFRSAEAASITSASDTLSSSAPSLASNHTISFEIETAMTAGQTIDITFPAEFTIPTLGVEDFDLTAGGVEQTLDLSNGAGQWGVATSGQAITFTSPSDTAQATNTVFVIEIGTNATAGGTGDSQIVNPAVTTSYAIDIDGTMTDTGQVRVAIVDQITISASVDTTLTFTVSGVGSGTDVTVSATNTSGTSTSNTLPFGTLGIDTSKVLAHDLTVTTNAKNGYTVTVVQTGPLQSTTGATIDGFIDGSNTNTPTAWQGPSELISDPNTYGHWGITSSDTAIPSRSGNDFVLDQWVAPSTTPIAVMGHTGPSDGSTTGIGAATIGYQAQISALQEAGDDYTTTLRYVATPTF